MPSALCPLPGRDIAWEGGAPPEPRLLSFHFSAVPGATSIWIYDSLWNYLAQIKYRSVRVSDSVVVFTSLNWFPAAPALGYAAGIRQNSIVPNEQYDLQYYLDCTPDVAGYTETWRTVMRWIQPDFGDDGIELPVYP